MNPKDILQHLKIKTVKILLHTKFDIYMIYSILLKKGGLWTLLCKNNLYWNPYISDILKSQHNYKNYLIYLLTLLEHKDYSKIELSIKEQLNADRKNVFITYTANKHINSIINYKYLVAQNENIHFQTYICIPRDIPYSPFDMCVLLGNVLDNAIDANKKMATIQRSINLFMKYDRGNLIIIVENPYPTKQKRKPITTKSDSIIHGFGLNIIREIVRKYNGYVRIVRKRNIFKIQIVLS